MDDIHTIHEIEYSDRSSTVLMIGVLAIVAIVGFLAYMAMNGGYFRGIAAADSDTSVSVQGQVNPTATAKTGY